PIAPLRSKKHVSTPHAPGVTAGLVFGHPSFGGRSNESAPGENRTDAWHSQSRKALQLNRPQRDAAASGFLALIGDAALRIAHRVKHSEHRAIRCRRLFWLRPPPPQFLP